MASYSYKDLCYQIPEYINKAFVDEFKREPDGDPGYDGDYWTLAAMYVEDLIKQRDELLIELEKAKAEISKRAVVIDAGSNHDGLLISNTERKLSAPIVVTVDGQRDEAGEYLAKAKGGAA